MGLCTKGSLGQTSDQAREAAAARFKSAREMNLPVVAEKLGFKFKKGQGEKYYSNSCPNCGEGRAGGNATSIFMSEAGIWRWSCFCCGDGGTAIDFMARAKSLSDREAVDVLVGANYAPVVCQKAIAENNAKAEAAAIALKEAIAIILQKGQTIERESSDYLRSRCISMKTQQEAVRRGMLRFLPANPQHCFQWLQDNIGEARLKKSGLWREGAKWPAAAFRPIVSVFPQGGSAEFRMPREPVGDEPKAIRWGHMKWPWWWKADSESSDASIMVIEGAIDLWSCVEMGVSTNTHIMALPGTGCWIKDWIRQAAAKNGVKTGLVGTDRDSAGQKVVEGMMKDIREFNLRAVRVMPELKDWNKDLCAGRNSF